MFQSVASRPVAEAPANHYAEATQLLTSGKLVPFLGLGVHFEVDDNAWGKNGRPAPALLNARTGNARFLFLGYSLRDWNIRFLLDRIWSSQRQELSWAVLFNTSRVTKTLWGKRGVEILDMAIEGYLAGLANEIASNK